MRVQFTVGIAAAAWSYYPTQIVDVGGEEYTTTMIPADIAAKWLACGHVVQLTEAPATSTAPVLETATIAPPEVATHPKRRRGPA